MEEFSSLQYEDEGVFGHEDRAFAGFGFLFEFREELGFSFEKGGVGCFGWRGWEAE
jgi:hypothetical protein